MSNIFKNFLGINADEFVFPDVDSIDVGIEELPQEELNEQEEQELLDENGNNLVQNGEEMQEQNTGNDENKTTDNDAQDISEEEFVNINDFEGKSKPFGVEFAEIQAGEIIADARKRAEAIVTEAATSAKLLRFSAESEIKQAQEDAYKKGMEEGIVEAKEKMAAQLEAQVYEFINKALKEKDEIIKKSQSEMCELALAVAEKVIQISLKSSHEVIARMIQVATEKLKRREWVRIYVCENDAQGIVESSPELTAALAGLSDNVKIVPLKDSEEGTCIIEMPDEIIDAGVSTQMKNIRATINNV